MKHSRRSALGYKRIAILAALAIPLGLVAYTGGFASAPAPVDQPVGYVAQDDITNFKLSSGTETLFRPEYNRQYWSGNLHAYPMDKAGLINTSAERWAGGAAGMLSSQNWDTGRRIGTMNDAGVGVPFRDTSMSTASFPAPGSISGNSYSRADILAYLRGDTTNEGGAGLRQRASPLGDIIHSRPYFVDDDQNDTVFVGANDGMLHAFDASSGAERWAYVPSMLQPNLVKLAFNPLDGGSNKFAHSYFVDGQINIGSISAGSSSMLALFGSLGAGGKGIYALNINSLTATSDADVASKVLWEITPGTVKYKGAASTAAYSHLGYTYGTPQLVKLNVGGSATDALIIGNGFDTGGYACLYVINAATGARIAEIRAGSGTPTAGSANGIFEPKALDTDGDGMVDRVYAADLNGSLWRFDLSASSASSWSATSIFTTAGNLPVTSTLGVVRHPNGGYMVDFGTGSTLSGSYGTYNHSTGNWTTPGTGDMATAAPATYSVYGIWDGPHGTVADGDLVTQTLEERSYSASSASTVTIRVRRATAHAIDWSVKKGWKVALPAGERVVGEGSFLENGRFYFNSYNPTIAPTLISGTNTDIYGENWLMELNALTGGSSASPFLDLDGNLLLDNNDRIQYGTGDTKPGGSSTGDPIVSPNEMGIPVGKFIATGVQSQPLLVELGKLNSTLMNRNPDVIYPPTSSVDRGVAGGHFDVDYFYPPTGNCSNLSGGTDPVSPVSSVNTQCSYTKHVNEYDDLYDKTGVNFLNPSSSAYLLSAAIPSAATPFKVLLMNQYLNPAVQIHIGRTDYNPASAVGYIGIKDYQTAKGLTISALPSYNRSTIGSLALNMPVDAFSVKNWWGASPADNRVGLMPTSPQCVYYGKVTSSGSNSASVNADLYNPVVPDTATPPTGPGTVGTDSGVRHNGAITIQIIKSSTPDTALELNYAGHPEYGYRIKSANFYAYVLAEYAVYWNHPSRVCFGDASTTWYNGSSGGNGYSTTSSGAWNTVANMVGSGWTKAAKPDTKPSTANATPAPNSTDPSLGALGSKSGTAAGVTTTVSNNVTTTKITYTDASYTWVVSTTTAGKTTITTTDHSAAGSVLSVKTVVIADASGSTTSGGTEKGHLKSNGRISWRELTGQ